MTPLTTKQAAVLNQIKTRIESKGCAPTVQDIAWFNDWSYTAAYRCIVALEAKGYIARERGKQNSIRLADQPDPAKIAQALRQIFAWAKSDTEAGEHLALKPKAVIELCERALS